MWTFATKKDNVSNGVETSNFPKKFNSMILLCPLFGKNIFFCFKMCLSWRFRHLMCLIFFSQISLGLILKRVSRYTGVIFFAGKVYNCNCHIKGQQEICFFDTNKYCTNPWEAKLLVLENSWEKQVKRIIFFVNVHVEFSPKNVFMWKSTMKSITSPNFVLFQICNSIYILTKTPFGDQKHRKKYA